MKVTVTKDGKLTVIPPLRSHIGEDVEDAISEIKEYRRCVLISDCIGFNFAAHLHCIVIIKNQVGMFRPRRGL